MAWAPDSRRIAYTRGDFGRMQILSRSVAGAIRRRQVTNEPPGTSFSEVRWLDGRVSYAATLLSNDFEIAIMSADGHGVRDLTRNFVDDREPDLSPDGSTIVYRRTLRTNGSRSSLRLIGVDGEHDRALTREGPWQDFSPAWSPDGLRIAFVRWQRNHGKLMAVNRDGSGLRTISSERDYYAGGISWSPDGRELVVAGRSEDFADLFFVQADGNGSRPLFGGSRGFGSYTPAWSPDGARILFWGTDVGPGPTRLYTVSPDGTDLHNFFDEGLANISLGGSWSPDGSRITFAVGHVPTIAISDTTGANFAFLTRDRSSNVDPDWGP